MKRRKNFAHEKDKQPVAKKQKLANGIQDETDLESVASPRDLQELLLFQPDDARTYRLSIYTIEQHKERS